MANVPHKVRNYFKLELLLEHSQILLRSLFKNRYSLFNSGNLWNNTQLCGSNYLANIIGKNKKINLTLTPMQKTSISNGDLTKWDISTLIILLLYDDRPKILTQQQVDREDQLLEELRSIRNRIMHHPTKSIDDLEFNQLWTDLIDILAGLGGDRNELNKQNNDSVFDVHSQFINEENVKEASRLNSLGTQSYKNDQYSDAIAFFTQAISLTDVSDTDRAVFYSNISASRLALCNNSNDEQYQALEDAKHARRLRLIWWKGHFRVGQVYAAINEHEKAIVSFERALVLDPSRAEIQNALYSSRQKYGIQSRYEYLDPRYTPRTLSEHLNETKVDQGVKLSDRLRRERKDPVEADVLKGHQYEHGDCK